MKILTAALFVLLCPMALCSCEKGRNYTPPTCCFSFVSQRIEKPVAYYKTSSECPRNGIIFLTKKCRHVCANPMDAWVQEYIKELETNP